MSTFSKIASYYDPYLDKKIGTTIRKLRVEAGMTQDQLANAIGYSSRSSIAGIEGGSRGIPKDQLENIAHLFGLSVEELIEQANQVKLNIYTLSSKDQIDKLRLNQTNKSNYINFDNLNENGKKKLKEYYKDLIDNPKYRKEE